MSTQISAIKCHPSSDNSAGAADTQEYSAMVANCLWSPKSLVTKGYWMFKKSSIFYQSMGWLNCQMQNLTIFHAKLSDGNYTLIYTVEKGDSPLYWASTAVLDCYCAGRPFRRLYVSFPLDGICLTLPPLHPLGTGWHAASVVLFVGPDSSFTLLWWTFAALRCRDLAGSSLAMSF